MLCKYYFGVTGKSDYVLNQISVAINSKEELEQRVEDVLKIWHYGVPPSAPAQEILAAAFKYEYKDQGGLDHLQNFIERDLLATYNKNPFAYYALISSMVQSSGYGKSRALLELGKNRINVVYLCLRSDKSTGFPPGNQNVLQYLKNCIHISDFQLFIAVTYLVAESSCRAYSRVCREKNIPTTNLPLSNSASDFFDTFWFGVLTQIQDIVKAGTQDDTINCFKKIQKSFAFTAMYHLKQNGMIVSENAVPRERLSELLIVLDEASELLIDKGETASIYRNLRRAQKYLGSRNCILMFVDTLSTVSSFAPPVVFDPSLRPIQGQDLLPVYYELQTYHRPPYSETNDLVRRYSYGRPLWWTLYFSGQQSQETLEKAAEFAAAKLSFSGECILKNNEAVLAVMSLKFGVYGIVDHSLASRLMSSYMATGIFIGPDRLRMVVTYVPEPILADAAALLLHDCVDKPATGWDSRVLQKHFTTFAAECISGLVDVGKIGELICRASLSLAFDYTIIRQRLEGPKRKEPGMTFLEPVTVRAFLQSLLSKEYLDGFKQSFRQDAVQLPETVLNSTLILAAWAALEVFPEKKLDTEFLDLAYDTGCGIIMPPNFGGINALVPLKRPDGTMGQMRLQFKAYEKGTLGQHLTSAAKMKASIVGSQADCNIFIDIGCDDLGHQPSPQRSTLNSLGSFLISGIMVIGLDAFKFLGQDLLTAMKMVRRSQIDRIQSAKRPAVLRTMNPLGCFFLPDPIRDDPMEL